MSAFSHDVSGAVEAYAAYLNAPRGILSSDEQALFDEDMARARAAMERAWLEATPVRDDATAPPPRVPWFLAWLGPIKRLARCGWSRSPDPSHPD
jgi:hypothetical protein